MRRPGIWVAAFGALILLLGAAAVAVVLTSATGGSQSAASAATRAPASPTATAGSRPAVAGRGYLGVRVFDVDAGTRAQFNLARDNGAVVVSVEQGSPAARAGLRAGDVIVAVDGKPVADVASLTSLLSTHHPGDRVSVGVFGGQQQRTLTLTLAATPPPASSSSVTVPNVTALPPALLAPILGALGSGSLNQFVSADVTTTNTSGKLVTTHIIGGVVESAGSDAVTITPNGGGRDQQFGISSATIISAGLGRNTAEALAAGTHVLVLTRGSSTTAQEIIAVDGLGGLIPALPSPSPGRIQVPAFPRPRATPTPSHSTQ